MKEKPVKRVQRVVTRRALPATNPKHGVVSQPELFRDESRPAVTQFGPNGGKLIGGVHGDKSRRLRLDVKTPVSPHCCHNAVMSLSSDLVAANLQRLMAASADCRSQAALARRSKVPQRTIGRILNKEVTPSLDVLEQLAKAFDLLPWQLLVPELDPRNAPVLRFATAAEEALYKRIVESAVELARQKQP
jgi:hypothetical protein